MTDRRHCARTAAVLLLAVGLAPAGQAAVAAPADPAPTPPSQAQVDRAKQAVAAATARQTSVQNELTAARAHLDEVTTKAALATEAYNAARVRLAERTAAAAAAAARATQTKAAEGMAQTALNDLAAQLYMEGGSLGGLEQLLAKDTGDIARRAADADAVTGYRNRTLTAATDAAAKAAAARRAAAAAQLQQKAAAAQAQQAFAAAKSQAEDAAAQEKALAAREQALVTELATLRRTSVALETKRQDALEAAAARAEEARAAAAAQAQAKAAAEARAAAQAQAQTATSSSASAPGEAPAPAGDLPAPQREAAAKAIEFAKQQLGEPYLWAAEGPGSWDCSGLTKGAWAVAGRSLTHYTGSQYQETQRVAIADLQPGDLVFYGSSVATIHHVGLYVGNGQMIEAPRTGLNVRYASIYRNGLLPFGGRVG